MERIQETGFNSVTRRFNITERVPIALTTMLERVSKEHSVACGDPKHSHGVGTLDWLLESHEYPHQRENKLALPFVRSNLHRDEARTELI
jgi:hypothetical protein